MGGGDKILTAKFSLLFNSKVDPICREDALLTQSASIWGWGGGGGISMKNSGEALQIVSYKTARIQTLYT